MVNLHLDDKEKRIALKAKLKGTPKSIDNSLKVEGNLQDQRRVAGSGLDAPHQCDLASLMSNISARCYQAGWMTNLEFVLWDAVLNGSRTYGHDLISASDIDQLKISSRSCECWIYFDAENEETAIDLDGWREMFTEAIRLKPHIIQD